MLSAALGKWPDPVEQGGAVAAASAKIRRNTPGVVLLVLRTYLKLSASEVGSKQIEYFPALRPKRAKGGKISFSSLCIEYTSTV